MIAQDDSRQGVLVDSPFQNSLLGAASYYCTPVSAPSPALHREQIAVAKIQRHESKASLLGGQPFDHSYQPFSGGFREREGYAPGPTGRGLNPPSKMYKPNTVWTWAFLLVVFVQAIIVLAFEA